MVEMILISEYVIIRAMLPVQTKKYVQISDTYSLENLLKKILVTMEWIKLIYF